MAGEYPNLEFIDRRGSDSIKWDGLKETFGRDGLLASWVADMDIASPACVREALRSYVDFNAYGYYRMPEGLFDAFAAWQRDRHGFAVEREQVRFIPGVVPGIYWFVQALTEPGDAVAYMPPVYYPFRNAVEDTGRTCVEVPLLRAGTSYAMDAQGLERAIVERDVKLFILCSPHNPAGRVWSVEELRSVLDVCSRHGVYVLSDEIHNDLVLSGNEHVVSANVGDYEKILVTFLSASKTFNMAAMGLAFAVVPDEGIRTRYDAFAKGVRMNWPGSFGCVAYRAAWRHGAPWLADLLHLIEDNYRILADGLAESLPQASIAPLQGTYLAWVDLGPYVKGCDIEEAMCDVCGLAVDYGSWFGGDAYRSFVRFNLATSPENVRETVRRLARLAR